MHEHAPFTFLTKRGRQLSARSSFTAVRRCERCGCDSSCGVCADACSVCTRWPCFVPTAGRNETRLLYKLHCIDRRAC
jgi:hypothetical protein